MQSLDSLRDLTDASPHLTAEELVPDYPVLLIERPEATARIALHGAHLMDWKPAGASPVIYTSPKAIFREGKAIRGGIPLCWPWFNAHPTDPSKPSHGFARNRFWTVATVSEEPGATVLTFGLPTSSETMALWPHQFGLEATMQIGDTLSVALRTTNLDSEPITIGGALHAYFSVGDLSEAAIDGFNGIDYLDCVGERLMRTQEGSIHFGGEVDRIYRAAPPVRLVDRESGRSIRIDSEGSCSTVVWNPFFQKAAALGDLPDDAYRDFVCIETANAGEDLVTLGPGDSHTLKTFIWLP